MTLQGSALTLCTMRRPVPSARLAQPGNDVAPALKVWEWARTNIVDPAGELYNPTHKHLVRARVGVLWTNVPNTSRGRGILGQAEMPSAKNPWTEVRQDAQFREWFGWTPDFLITLYAPWAAECTNLEFCALVEHEMLHCAQAKNPMTGALRFTKAGGPVFALRGHDVEEFIDIIRRYGAIGAGSDVVRLVEAAWEKPTVGRASVANACGACLRRAA